MTADQLKAAEQAFQTAYRRAENLREIRNRAVIAALKDGWTHKQVSGATGLSRGRISQIKPKATLR